MMMAPEGFAACKRASGSSKDLGGSVELVAGLLEQLQQRLLRRLAVRPLLRDLAAHLRDGLLHHAQQCLLGILARLLLADDGILQPRDLVRGTPHDPVLHGLAALGLLSQAVIELRNVHVDVTLQGGLCLQARAALPRDLLPQRRGLLVEGPQQLGLGLPARLLLRLQRFLKSQVDASHVLALGIVQSLAVEALLVEVALELCQLLPQLAAVLLKGVLRALQPLVQILQAMAQLVEACVPLMLQALLQARKPLGKPADPVVVVPGSRGTSAARSCALGQSHAVGSQRRDHPGAGPSTQGRDQAPPAAATKQLVVWA
mmetsp:Transcript_21250/g.61350  ORF Transcript_21250/g.61350 Transcript_21250/m.61350 type:complete len:316 (+) Transcript_21250:3-950(+)